MSDRSAYRRCRRNLLEPTRLYAWRDLAEDLDVLPDSGGIYGWYFDRHLRGVPKRGCHGVSRRKLLYVGISPSGTQSSGTLRSRVMYHFTGNASGSTLRTTLASLLGPSLHVRFRRTRAGGHRLTSSGEDKLSLWMEAHARVCWAITPRPWEIETKLIASLSLPLNLSHNRDHPFCPELTELRRRARTGVRANRG